MTVWNPAFEADARARLTAGVVGYAMAMPTDVVLSRNRTPRVSSARHVVMYLLATTFGMTVRRVALALDRDPSTVSNAIRRIEERCEDARYEAWLERLDACLRAAPAAPIGSAS